MTAASPPSRLAAIADLIGSAEGLHGEFCGATEFEQCCGESTFDALRALGVTDIEISAARRKRERDIREYYRQQRQEVSHRA